MRSRRSLKVSHTQQASLAGRLITPSYSKYFWLSGNGKRVYQKKIIFDHVTLIKVKNKHEENLPMPKVCNC